MFSTPGGEGCAASITLPPGQSVRVQVFRGDPSKWYSVEDLSHLWKIKPVTVRVWLHRARRGGFPPRADQIKQERRNAARRWTEIRADYANVLESLFKGRTIRMK